MSYMMPPLDLLTESQARKTIDISVVEDMRQRIIDGFKKNKVEVCELSVIAGPTVVRFEFAPNEGCKIKQIRSCENILNESLSGYGPIRIIAPVPAKGTFAVEVPRPDIQIAQLREVLEADGIIGPQNGVKSREALKKKDSNDKHESHKSLFERLLNLLASEDDDDLEDYQPKTTISQIVTDNKRDKNDTIRWEYFITEFLKVPEPYKFPYEDYQIIGDTADIDKVIRTCGMINIDS